MLIYYIIIALLVNFFSFAHKKAIEDSIESKKLLMEQPFVFGQMADVQYADMDNRRIDTPREIFHRAVLHTLLECVEDLNQRQPAFLIQLGDLIDGHRHDDRKARSPSEAQKDQKKVLQILNHLEMDIYHVIGNHCLPVGKDVLLNFFNLHRFYYDFVADSAKGWRFVVLDGTVKGQGLMDEKQINWLSRVCL